MKVKEIRELSTRFLLNTSVDNTLIPFLDEKCVEYTCYNESNWLSDMLFGWVLPVFIFFAIWMFLANRMQKNM